MPKHVYFQGTIIVMAITSQFNRHFKYFICFEHSNNCLGIISNVELQFISSSLRKICAHWFKSKFFLPILQISLHFLDVDRPDWLSHEKDRWCWMLSPSDLSQVNVLYSPLISLTNCLCWHWHMKFRKTQGNVFWCWLFIHYTFKRILIGIFLDSEDDYRLGCRKVSQHQQK